MSIVSGADVRDARREHPGDANGSLPALLMGGFMATRQIFIDSLADQVSNGSSTLRRELPKGPELALCQLHLRSKKAHAIMITKVTSWYHQGIELLLKTKER